MKTTWIKKISKKDLFLLFYSIPTAICLFLWLVNNARGVGDGTGYLYGLLFHPRDLFTDWLIPHAWAVQDNPWMYAGSKFEGLLPPSLYGPSIFLFLKLLPGGENLNEGEVIGHITIAGILILTTAILTGSTVEILSKSKKVSATIKKPLITSTVLLFSYPVVFALNRGNTSIISLFFLTSFIYLVAQQQKSYTWVIPLILYCTSSIQLLPLLGLSGVLICRSKRGLKYITGAITPIAIYTISTKVGWQDIKSSYEAGKKILGTSRFYNHDILSGLSQLTTNTEIAEKLVTVSTAVSILIVIITGVTCIYAIKNTEVSLFRDYNIEKSASQIMTVVFMYSLMSLIISVPSADYHLVRIIPFLLILVFGKRGKKDDKDTKSLKIIGCCSGLLFSYTKLWGLFIATDLSVTLRSLSLIIIFYESAKILAIRIKSINSRGKMAKAM